MSTTWIKVAYAVVLGLAVAMTVGFGVATFITPPRTPQPVGISFTQLNDQTATDQTTADAQTKHQESLIDGFYKDAQAQRGTYPEYQRNIFLTFAGIGLLIAVIGVALPAVVNYLRLGFLIGGGLLAAAAIYVAVQAVPNAIPPTSSVLTLLGLGQTTVLDTAGRFLRFAISVVGMLVLVFVGLWRLTDWVMTPRVVMTPAGGVPASVAPIAVPVASTAPPAATDRWSRPEERATSLPSYAPPTYAPAQATVTPAESVASPPDSAAPSVESAPPPRDTATPRAESAGLPANTAEPAIATELKTGESGETIERRDAAPL